MALSIAVIAQLVTGASAADRTVVLAFGDSLTQGYGLSAEQGFVAQMQAWLQAQGVDIRLINGGVSGDTTAGGAARIAWSLSGEVDAVIVELGGNDMLQGLDPQQARANLAAILKEISARGLPVLLVGLPAPGNFGAEFQAGYRALYPALAGQYGALYYPDFLAGLGANQDRETALRQLMQSDGIHPNAAGVARIVEAMGPSVLELVEAARER